MAGYEHALPAPEVEIHGGPLLLDAHLRNSRDELSVPVADVIQVMSHFGTDVPGQNHYVLRPLMTNVFLGDDGNAAAGKILALFGGIAIDDIGDEVTTHAGVI